MQQPRITFQNSHGGGRSGINYGGGQGRSDYRDRYDNNGGRRSSGEHQNNRGGYQQQRGRESNYGGRSGGRFNSGPNHGGRDNFRGGRGNGQQDSGGRIQKRIPGNMVPKKTVDLPQEVLLAKELIIRVGDLTALKPEDDLIENIKTVADTFVAAGFKEFADDISNIFAKCFSQLSIQTPILATVLALIHDRDPEFTNLVVTKIKTKLNNALEEDDVLQCKLLLRAVASLSSCNVFALLGSNSSSIEAISHPIMCGGLIDILDLLLDVVAPSLVSDTGAGLVFSPAAQEALYLVACTMPWAPIKRIVQEQSSDNINSRGALLDKVVSVLSTFMEHWRTPFVAGAAQAIFNGNYTGEVGIEEIDGNEVPATPLSDWGPSVETGSCVYDSLYEACKLALYYIELTAPIASDTRASSAGDSSGALARLGNSVPRCMPTLMPWIILQERDGELPAIRPEDAPAVLSFDNSDSASNGNESHRTECMVLLQRVLGAREQHCGLVVGASSGGPSGVVGMASSSAWLHARFAIFDSSISEECAACCKILSSAEKALAFGFMQDIVRFFDPVVNPDGTIMGSIGLLTSHLTSVFKLFPADAHLEYLVVEMFFQIILLTPADSVQNTCAARVLLDLCKKNALFPPAIALGVNVVFQMIPDLDTVSWREFGKWFSFHLINTKLSWPYWDFWVSEYQEAVGAEPTEDAVSTMVSGTSSHPTKSFCLFVVDRVARTLSNEKAQEAFPVAFRGLLPLTGSEVLGFPLCSLYPTNEVAKASAAMIVPPVEGAEEGKVSADDTQETVVDSNPIATKLRKMIDEKEDRDDIEEWLIDVDDAEVDDVSGEHWRGHYLLQAMLRSAGSTAPTLSSILSVLDRYGELLRSVTDSDDAQVVLLTTLFEAYGCRDAGVFNFVLDEMLRRGQIGTHIVAEWLTTGGGGGTPSAFAQSLCEDSVGTVSAQPSTWKFAHIETVVDRAIDFAKASVAQRREMGGEMAMDSSLNCAEPTPRVEGAMRTTRTGGSENGRRNAATSGEVDDDDDEERSSRRRRDRGEEDDEDLEDDNDDNQSKKRRLDPDASEASNGNDDIAATDAAQNEESGAAAQADDDDEEEDDEDPVWLATEAVRISLGGTRKVFKIVVATLAEAIISLRTGSMADGNEAEAAVRAMWMHAAQALLNRVMRSFLGAERFLGSIASSAVSASTRPVVLTASADEVNSEILKGDASLVATWATWIQD